MMQVLPHLRGRLAGNVAAMGSELAWEFDASTGSIVPSRGTGTASFTRATTATVTDWEGVVRDALSGEVRLDGMRRVENLVATTSEDFSNAAWTKTAGTITAGVTDPLGGATAYTFTASGGAGLLRQEPLASFSNGTVFRNSVWLRRRTGTGVVQVYTGGDSAEITAVTSSLTTSWQRFAANTGTKAGAGTNRIGIRLATDGDAVDVWRIQSEDVTTQAATAPAAYVSKGALSAPYHGVNVDGVKYFATTNGNTVASNVVTEAAGTALTNFGYLSEPASTNPVLQSENFGTTWVPVGTPTRSAAAKRVGRVVLDLIGDDDALSVKGYSQNVVFTGDAVKAFSVHVSQGTATDSLFRIRDTTVPATRLDGVLSWSGGLPSLAMTTGTFEGYDTLANGVFRLRFTTTSITAANTNSLQIYPAANNVTDVTDTGNLYVGGVQAENALFCSSYIPTTTATVTRNADVDSYSSVTGLGTVATLYVEAYAPTIAATDVALDVNDTTANERLSLRRDSSGDPRFTVVDGGVTQADVDAGAWAAGALGKLAGSAATNDVQTSIAGGAPVTDATATMPTVTTIHLGHSNSASQFRGRIRKARLYNVAKGADVQALTA